MNNEIKEIDNSDLMELLETTSKKEFYRLTLDHELVVRLYNWVTNLQEENKELLEKFSNKIEEVSNLIKENECFKVRCEYLQRSCERKEKQMLDYRMEYMEQEDYKSRNEKAIEDIDKFISGHYIEGKGDITVNYLVPNPCCEDRLNIIKKDLLGEDE